MSKYSKKDKIKFKPCNKLISQGAKGSSSYKYAKKGVGKISKKKVNTGKYKEKDIVGISVNGARRNRLTFNKKEVNKAMKAKVTFVADSSADRAREYNQGEREFAIYLKMHDYIEVKSTNKRTTWMHVKNAIPWD